MIVIRLLYSFGNSKLLRCCLATLKIFFRTLSKIPSLLKDSCGFLRIASHSLVSFLSEQMLDLFGETCTQRGYSSLRLDGSTPTALRMGLVDRFNDLQGKDRKYLIPFYSISRFSASSTGFCYFTHHFVTPESLTGVWLHLLFH